MIDSTDVNYELHILCKMLEQLPAPMATLLHDQTKRVIDAVNAQFKLVADLKPHVDDALLFIKMLEFDLHATKAERDSYKAMLDQN